MICWNKLAKSEHSRINQNKWNSYDNYNTRE